MARTIHLVYPHRPRISAPDSIGYQLGQRLEQHYPVKYYDWDERPGHQTCTGRCVDWARAPGSLDMFSAQLSASGLAAGTHA